MEYLSRAEKRKRAIRLYIGYGLISIAVLLSTIILVYEAKGYDIDPGTRKVIQNGLINVNNEPEQADIYIDGKKEKSKTEAKLVLPAGQHSITVKHDGYIDWQKNIILDGGSIEYATYIRLFPTNPTKTVAKSFTSSPIWTSKTPDKRWLYIQPTINNGTLTRVDLNEQRYVAEEVLYTNILQNLDDPITSTIFLSWSQDSRAGLLKNTLASGAVQYVWLNVAKPADSKIISTLSFPSIDFISFKEKNDEFYIRDISNNGLREVRLADDFIGEPLINIAGTISKQPDGSLVYFNDDALDGSIANVYIFTPDTRKTFKLTSVVKDQSAGYSAVSERFDSKWRMIITSKSDDKVQLFINPTESLKQQTETSGQQSYKPIIKFKIGTQSLSMFSENGRFLASQSGNTMVVYDADTSRSYRFNISRQNAKAAETQKPTVKWRWFDNAHIEFLEDKTLSVCDFDKTNCVINAVGVENQFSTMNRIGTHCYYLLPSSAGIDLIRSSLITQKQ